MDAKDICDAGTPARENTALIAENNDCGNRCVRQLANVNEQLGAVGHPSQLPTRLSAYNDGDLRTILASIWWRATVERHTPLIVRTRSRDSVDSHLRATEPHAPKRANRLAPDGRSDCMPASQQAVSA